MKWLILICVSCPPAFGAISLVSSKAVANAATVTFTIGPKVGDIIVGCAFRSGSTTPPTATANYTAIDAPTGANTASLRTEYKISDGTETSLAMTNASSIGYWILRGEKFDTPVGGHLQSSGTVNPVSYGGITMSVGDGTSFILACGANKTATSMGGAPTGLTQEANGDGGASVDMAVFDSNGGKSSWATQTVNAGTSTTWRSNVIEIEASSANYASPIANIVHAINPGISNDITSCTTVGNCTTFNLPWIGDAANSGSLASNSLAVCFTYSFAGVTDPAPGGAGTTPNVYANADTAHVTWTWTKRTDLAVAGNSNHQYCYTADVATAGITSVHVAFTAHVIDFEWAAWELKGVNGVDTTSIIEPTGSLNTSGTLTPTQTGDIGVWHCSASTMETPYTAGTLFVPSPTIIGWSDANSGRGGGAFIWNSTSSFTFTADFITEGTGNNSICSYILFKASAGTGTAPTSPYIIRADTTNVPSGATDNYDSHNLKTGDALLLTANGPLTASAVQWCTTGGVQPCIVDTQGDTFTNHQPADAGGGYPNFGLDCNIAIGDGKTTVDHVNTGATPAWWQMEIVGLDNSSHTACYDSAATGSNTNGGGAGQAETGTMFALSNGTATPSATPNLTPSTANGIVLASSEMGTGTFPMSNTSPSGAMFMVATYNGQTDTSNMGLGNMFAYYEVTSTGNESWNWSNGSSTTFNASAIHLKIAAAAAGGFNKRQKLDKVDP